MIDADYLLVIQLKSIFAYIFILQWRVQVSTAHCGGSSMEPLIGYVDFELPAQLCVMTLWG